MGTCGLRWSSLEISENKECSSRPKNKDLTRLPFLPDQVLPLSRNPWDLQGKAKSQSPADSVSLTHRRRLSKSAAGARDCGFPQTCPFAFPVFPHGGVVKQAVQNQRRGPRERWQPVSILFLCEPRRPETKPKAPRRVFCAPQPSVPPQTQPSLVL